MYTSDLYTEYISYIYIYNTHIMHVCRTYVYHYLRYAFIITCIHIQNILQRACTHTLHYIKLY